MPVINHSISVGEFSSLKAIPISGIVTVEVIDADNVIVGSTRCKSNGEWIESFYLDPGQYTILFRGDFHPIGKGQPSRYLTTTKIIKIPIEVTTLEITEI